MTHRPLAAALCLAGLALAGCGGSPPALPLGSSHPALGAAAAIPPNASLAGLTACTLVSSATLRQSFGGLALPCSGNGLHGSIDLPVSAADPSDVRATVTVLIAERSDYGLARMEALEDSSEGSRTAVTSVPGIGDSAFTITPADAQDDDPEYALWAASGGRAVEIDIDSQTPSDVRAVRQMMTSALGRL